MGTHEIIKKALSGTSWEKFYKKINSIIFGKEDDDEKKLLEIRNYIEEINAEGGIGEVETITITRRLGGICFDCKNADHNCAILPKNRTECKWHRGEE